MKHLCLPLSKHAFIYSLDESEGIFLSTTSTSKEIIPKIFLFDVARTGGVVCRTACQVYLLLFAPAYTAERRLRP